MTPVEPAPPSPMALAGTKPHPEEPPAPTPDLESPDLEAVAVEAVAVESPEVVSSDVETPAVEEQAPKGARRRGAKRAAAAPAVSQPAVSEPDEPDASAAEPADEPVLEAARQAPSEPAAPVVVTTTRRRRAAGRPAGPAVATGVTPDVQPVETAAASDADEGPEVGPEAEADDTTPVFHVPVKKRGARKR